MSFSLGSLAGGVAEGFTKEQQLALQQAAQQSDIAAQTAAGNALGGTMAQPQQNPLMGLLGKLGITPEQIQIALTEATPTATAAE